jgi:hypothetical protein
MALDWWNAFVNNTKIDGRWNPIRASEGETSQLVFGIWAPWEAG